MPEPLGSTTTTFQTVAGHRDFTARDGGSVAVEAGAASAVAAADDVEFVAGIAQGTAVVFEAGPDTLIVVGRLRHHIAHEEGGRIISYRDIAVGGGAVTAVETGAGVAAAGGAEPAAGQGSISHEVVLAGSAAGPSAAQVPVHPVGLAFVAAVRGCWLI